MNDVQIKLDVNFLDKPLWFVNIRHDGNGFVWEDIDGYEYRSGYKAPDKTDFLFLLYFLHKSQKNAYSKNLNLSRWEIVKGCGLDTRTSYYYERLEESLERWTNVTIKFKGCFYDGGSYKALIFGILDSGMITENGKVTVNFNSSWLTKIKESNFFKHINFYRYKSLKRPISRRLHEILSTKFISRKEWSIGLVNLGKKLTLAGRETKRGSVIYASDVLVALKPAVNEINNIPKNSDILDKMGFSKKDIFTISYTVKGERQDRVVVFEKIACKVKKSAPKISDKKLLFLFDLLRIKTERIEKYIKECYENKGFDYVKWSIMYSNRKSKKNYFMYLKNVLDKGWASEWSEEQKEAARRKEEKEVQIKDGESKKSKIIKLIESRGEGVTYKGEKFNIMTEYGLDLYEVNVLESWDQVDITQFEF